MKHDFAVPAMSAAMNVIEWDQSGEVTFDVPSAIDNA